MTDWKIYIQPLGFLRGCVASDAVKAGHARPLAGGALAFSLMKIIFRAGAERRENLVPALGLEAFTNELPSFQQDEIFSLLERISAPRPDMNCRKGQALSWHHPLLMAIVNVTPDSFSDGGQFESVDRAVEHARCMIEAGADIIDIGGESTRPGAAQVSIEAELDRVIPVIERLSDSPVPISIDSRNGPVMAKALAAGATIINDVSALNHDEKSLEIACKSKGPLILMHARNSPENMQNNPQYEDVQLDIYDYLEKRIEICHNAGIDRHRLIVDPGIGFGKSVAHNREIMAGLSLFHGLGVPILLGVSRKSFIGHITGEPVPHKRLPASLAAGQLALDQGVQILRVHDMAECRQARDIWCEIK